MNKVEVLGSTEKTHGVRVWRLSGGRSVPVDPSSISIRDIDDTLEVIDVIDETNDGNVLGSVTGLSMIHPLVEVTAMLPAMPEPDVFLPVSEETYNNLMAWLPV